LRRVEPNGGFVGLPLRLDAAEVLHGGHSGLFALDALATALDALATDLVVRGVDGGPALPKLLEQLRAGFLHCLRPADRLLTDPDGVGGQRHRSTGTLL